MKWLGWIIGIVGIVSLIFSFTGTSSNIITKEKEVRATITDKCITSGMVGRTPVTRYMVKAEYNELTDVEDNGSLYSALEKGDKVNAAIMVEKNKTGKIINRYLQIGD